MVKGLLKRKDGNHRNFVPPAAKYWWPTLFEGVVHSELLGRWGAGGGGGGGSGGRRGGRAGGSRGVGECGGAGRGGGKGGGAQLLGRHIEMVVTKRGVRLVDEASGGHPHSTIHLTPQPHTSPTQGLTITSSPPL